MRRITTYAQASNNLQKTERNNIMKITHIALAIMAATSVAVAAPDAPSAHADPRCAPGYVVGVPLSNGQLPVKCVPQNNIPPGYVDGTGGNAPLAPGYGPTGNPAGYHKTDDPNDPWYGHNGPCNSNDVTVIKVTERGNAIERWGPKGCDPTLPMTGTN